MERKKLFKNDRIGFLRNFFARLLIFVCWNKTGVFDILESGIVEEYFEWPDVLLASTQYTFSVRTHLACDALGTSLYSDWVDIITYTSPAKPDLLQTDFSATSITLDVTDSAFYDAIRFVTSTLWETTSEACDLFSISLYVDLVEVTPAPTSWPVEVSDLVPGTSYDFFIVVTKFGSSAQSDVITWCTSKNQPC